MNKIYIFSALCVMVFILLSPKHVEASCAITSIGNTNITNSVCSIDSFTVEGTDIAYSEDSTENTAILTLIDTAITINTNASLITGTMNLEGASSVSILATGASIKTGAVWTVDTDADGWPSNPLELFDTPSEGRRRLGLMASTETLDCNDGSSSVTNSCCVEKTRYQDADGDGYGNPAEQIFACATDGYVTNGDDCDDSDPDTYPGTVYCP